MSSVRQAKQGRSSCRLVREQVMMATDDDNVNDDDNGNFNLKHYVERNQYIGMKQPNNKNQSLKKYKQHVA